MTKVFSSASSRQGEVMMNGFYAEEGPSVQLTFPVPDKLYGLAHVEMSHTCGWWFLSLTKEQAAELSVALAEFVAGTRVVIEDD